MEFKIITEENLEACIDVFIEVFNDDPWNDEWTKETARQYVSDFYKAPNFLGIIAVKNDEILGFLYGVNRAWWTGREFYINEMGVKKEARNKGIGKALVEALEKELEGNNVKYISLLTDRGMPAEEFYKAIGFEEVERLVFYSKSI
ncbi:MAG: GNAT family N-acetyltransferase [Gemella sp.]|nr:GNAT family N-acetyltransferase [Gemella sp.]